MSLKQAYDDAVLKVLQSDGKRIAELDAECYELRQQLTDMTAERDKAKAMPMKYRRMEFNAQLQNENESLRQQLTALKSELKTIGNAIDDPRTDLTMTMSEVIIEQKKQLAAALAACKVKDAALQSAISAHKYESGDLHDALAIQPDDMKDVILCHAEPRAWNETITGRLATSDDHHRSRFPMCYEPLYRAWEPTK